MKRNFFLLEDFLRYPSFYAYGKYLYTNSFVCLVSEVTRMAEIGKKYTETEMWPEKWFEKYNFCI